MAINTALASLANTTVRNTPTFTYYVDSVGGLDANNGTTISTPFQNLTALPTLVAGNSVGLKYGSTWRQEITISVNNITIQGYGTGTKPIIDCSDVIAPGSFTKTGGRTNVYQATVSPELNVDAQTNVNVWENNAYLTYASSIANCDATPGSYFPSSNTTAPITLYINPVGSTNPTSDGNTYEFSSRQSGVNCNYSPLVTGTTVRNLTTKKNLHDHGSIIVSLNSLVEFCDMNQGSKHNTYGRTNTIYRDCTSTDSYYYIAGATHYVIFETAPAGGTNAFIRCIATETTFNNNAEGFIVHIATPGTGGFDRTDFIDCRVTNCGYGYAPNDTTNSYFRNCTTVNTLIGWISGTGITNMLMNGCQFIDNISSDVSRPILCLTAALSGSVNWFIDSFYCSTAQVLGGAILATVNSNYTLTNSQFSFGSSGTEQVLELNSPVVSTVVSNNNAFVGATYLYFFQPGVTYSLTSNNNCFDLSSLRNYLDGVVYTTIASYQAAKSQDAGSTIGSCNVTGTVNLI